MSNAAESPGSVAAEAITTRAQRFAREGRHLAAALEYQALAELHPHDVNAALKWAYHASKGGQRERAADGYLHAGCIYAAKGEASRAARLAHRAFEIGAARLTRSRIEPIARMNGAALELLLESAALEHAKAGRVDEASELYVLLGELEPDNSTLVSGEIRSDDHVDIAPRSLREAAERLHAKGRTEEYVRVVETMVAGGSADPDSLLELARIYLRRGDASAAASKLELLRGMAPDRLEAAELVLQAYAILGRTREGLQVLQDIAHRREHEPLLVKAMFDRAAGLPSRDLDWPCAIRSLADWMQSQATAQKEESLAPPPPPAWGTMAPRLPSLG